MEYTFKKNPPCSVCGLDTFRHKGWFLVIENRWLDRLKILSWHPSLARRKGVQSVCCRLHLKTLIVHWLTQASLRVAPTQALPVIPSGCDPDRDDVDLGSQALGRVVGELAVHRESLSRVWTGSPQSLEYILDALITIEEEDKPQAMNFQLFTPHLPRKSSLFNKGAGRGLALPALPPTLPVLFHRAGHRLRRNQQPIPFSPTQVFQYGAPLFLRSQVNVGRFPPHRLK